MNEEILSSPKWFIIDSILDNDRIDCQYYDPTYFETINDLQQISKQSGLELANLEKLLEKSSRHSLTGGATPKGAAYPLEGIPFIRVQNIKEYGIELQEAVFIEKRIHEGELKRSQLRAKDVLLTITGTYGISTTVPDGIDEANINQHAVRIRCDTEKVIPEYLSLYLNSVYGRKQMDRAATGSTRFALDYNAIQKLQILKPSRPLQEDIIEEVQKIYQEANVVQDTISRLEASCDSIVLEKLDITLPEEPQLKIFLSYLQTHDRLEVKWYYPYFEQVIKRIQTSESKRLGECKHKLKYGASIDADYVSDIPFLRIENLRRNYIDLSDLQYVPSGYKNQVAGLYLQEGDILIGRSGTYVGLCSFVPKGIEDYVYGSYIIRLRLDDEALLPQYISVYLNSVLGRIQYDKLKTGSLQFNINMQQISDIVIIKPDISVQEDVASSVFSLIDQVSALKREYNQRILYAKKRFIELLI